MNRAPSRSQLYAEAVSWCLYHWHQARAHWGMSIDIYFSPEAAEQHREWAEEEADTARRWAQKAKRMRITGARRKAA